MTKRAMVVAVAVTTVALLVGGAYLVTPGLRPSAAGEGLEITAQFDNAVGLYTGNTVAVLGMPVGEVTSITMQGTHIDVAMRIEPGVQLPADVTAVTVGTSILTDRHVELTPAYTSGATLADGTVLPLVSTRTPIEFDRVLNMVDQLGGALGGDGAGGGPVADVLSATSAITSTSGQQIKSALGKLSEALRTGDDGGAATRQSISAIVSNLASLTEAAAQNEDQVREFGSYVRQLSDILAQEGVGRGETGRMLTEVLDELNAMLGANDDNIAATLGSSTALTTALVDYRRELAEVFNVAPLAVDNVANAIDSENGMLRVGAHFDSVFFDSSMTKEVCNILGLRQLGCRTGSIRDLGPDFGVSSVLEGLTRLGE